MRIIKTIAGLGCFVAALFPGLLVLGELNFGFNLPFAVCALGLVGAGFKAAYGILFGLRHFQKP
jgi:hypothetical protein